MLKITSFACIFQIFGYANNTTCVGPSPILRPLYKRYFYHINIEMWSQIYTRTIRKCFFEDILFLCAFPIVIPIVYSISNLDNEGVDLSCWIFVADQCTKRHNKNSQPRCLDVFDKKWNALIHIYTFTYGLSFFVVICCKRWSVCKLCKHVM